MTILDTFRHLVDKSAVWVDEAEKAAHLAAVDASELDSLLIRLQAVETRLAAYETAAGYAPTETLAPDQAAAVATPKAKS